MRAICALAAMLSLASLGSSASSRSSAQLPREGLAVQDARGVTLVGVDGRVRRTLPGFRLRFTVERPGQVQLRAGSGESYELRRGVLARVATNRITLARGYALSFRRSRWTLLRRGHVVERFARLTHVELDDTGFVLTSFRVGDDGTLATRPVARRLDSGARRVLPRGCRVGAERRGVRFELCGYPFLKRRVATIVRVDVRGRRVLAGPARTASHGPAGWWRSIKLSPDGSRLLAEWSGECEVPEVHLFDARRGRTGRTTVLATTRDGAAAEASSLGWIGDAALVVLHRGACGPSAERPGVYAYDRDSQARLIYRLRGSRPTVVAFWH